MSQQTPFVYKPLVDPFASVFWKSRMSFEEFVVMQSVFDYYGLHSERMKATLKVAKHFYARYGYHYYCIKELDQIESTFSNWHQSFAKGETLTEADADRLQIHLCLNQILSVMKLEAKMSIDDLHKSIDTMECVTREIYVKYEKEMFDVALHKNVFLDSEMHLCDVYQRATDLPDKSGKMTQKAWRVLKQMHEDYSTLYHVILSVDASDEDAIVACQRLTQHNNSGRIDGLDTQVFVSGVIRWARQQAYYTLNDAVSLYKANRFKESGIIDDLLSTLCQYAYEKVVDDF